MTPAQEATNLFAALLFAILFIGGCVGLLMWWASERLLDWLDGRNDEPGLTYKDFGNAVRCTQCEWPIDDNGRCLCEELKP
jgi:hypothetical protein